MADLRVPHSELPFCAPDRTEYPPHQDKEAGAVNPEVAERAGVSSARACFCRRGGGVSARLSPELCKGMHIGEVGRNVNHLLSAVSFGAVIARQQGGVSVCLGGGMYA
jgi:hypothetical protein